MSLQCHAIQKKCENVQVTCGSICGTKLRGGGGGGMQYWEMLREFVFHTKIHLTFKNEMLTRIDFLVVTLFIYIACQ